MEDRNQISNLIYNYFFNRLIFCSYQYGEQLPPIDTLCNEFGVSPPNSEDWLRCSGKRGTSTCTEGAPPLLSSSRPSENAMQLSQDYFILRRDALS